MSVRWELDEKSWLMCGVLRSWRSDYFLWYLAIVRDSLPMSYIPLLDLFILCFACMYVCVWTMYLHAWYQGSKKKVLDLVELELLWLLAIMWVMGMEPRSSARAISTLNGSAIFPNAYTSSFKNVGTSLTKLLRRLVSISCLSLLSGWTRRCALSSSLA